MFSRYSIILIWLGWCQIFEELATPEHATTYLVVERQGMADQEVVERSNNPRSPVVLLRKKSDSLIRYHGSISPWTLFLTANGFLQ
jgi:hypothetical protein